VINEFLWDLMVDNEMLQDISNVGRFAYRSIRLQADSRTLRSIRLHDLSCFTYT